jgi:hypothetical protein
MFWNKKKKEPKRIVEITIIVNLFNINSYLTAKGDDEPNPIPKNEWENEVSQQHRIFIIPPTESQPEYYFHRSVEKPSHSLLGAHTLSVSGTEDVKSYCEDVGIVGDLEWDMWHNFLCVSIDRKMIAFVPIIEAYNIQSTGNTSAKTILIKDESVVKFPASLDGARSFNMHQIIGSEGVIYSNEFVAVIFEAPTRLVNYDFELQN